MSEKRYIKGKGGKMEGSVPGKTDAPVTNPLDGNEPPLHVVSDNDATRSIDDQYSQIFENTIKGDEAPALAHKIRGYGRLYIDDPNKLDLVKADPTAALENGDAYPSITNCMSHLDKPALQHWAANESAAEAAKRMELINSHLEAGRVTEAQELIANWKKPCAKNPTKTVFEDEVARARFLNRDEAAAKGTNVHSHIENLTHGKTVTPSPEEAGYVQGYQQFRQDNPHLRPVGTEFTVLSKEYGYMGTADALYEDTRNGDLYVVDYKTNKNAKVYDDVGAQLGALGRAETIVQSDGTKYPLPRIKGGIGVGLGPNGDYTARPFNLDHGFQTFKGLPDTWKGKAKLKTTDKTSPSIRGANDLDSFFAA